MESRPEAKRSYDSQLHIRDNPRGTKTARMPFTGRTHKRFLESAAFARKHIDKTMMAHPVLFPQAMEKGYRLHGFTQPSKKMGGLKFRRIELKATGDVFSIAPSFVMPYLISRTRAAEGPLFLKQFGVPCWALAHVFGRNASYWYRAEKQLGRNSIVGTTVKDPDKLPVDLLADEKHTRENGKKRFIATTIGGDCILGASVAPDAGTESLKTAYGRFVQEAQDVRPDYQPKTINIDGWPATKAALLALFPSSVVISCFLHGFLKIRDRCRHMGSTFIMLAKFAWEAYRSETADQFLARMSELKTWTEASMPKGPGRDAVLKLCNKSAEYAHAYKYPTAHRTSARLDRIMDRIDRVLYNAKYFHGHLNSSEDLARAMALIYNFRPFCPQSPVAKEYSSPAHRLNGFVYVKDSWLENLLVSASMGGIRCPPQNPSQ